VGVFRGAYDRWRCLDPAVADAEDEVAVEGETVDIFFVLVLLSEHAEREEPS